MRGNFSPFTHLSFGHVKTTSHWTHCLLCFSISLAISTHLQSLSVPIRRPEPFAISLPPTLTCYTTSQPYRDHFIFLPTQTHACAYEAWSLRAYFVCMYVCMFPVRVHAVVTVTNLMALKHMKLADFHALWTFSSVFISAEHNGAVLPAS
jgi:hypothetical protein